MECNVIWDYRRGSKELILGFFLFVGFNLAEFCLGAFVLGAFVLRAFVFRGFCLGGFCLGAFVRDSGGGGAVSPPGWI